MIEHPHATEPRTIRIVLPYPPSELSPNARCHWAAKAKKIKKYRQDARLFALEMTKGEKGIFVRPLMRLAFYAKDKRSGFKDGDNAIGAFKAGRDGIADSGMVADDSVFDIASPIVLGVDKENPRVEVIITEQGP